MGDVGSGRWIVAAVLATAGVLVHGIGWPSARDRPKRNRIAGIRTRRTLRSNLSRYTAQRAGARRTQASGVAALLGALAVAVYGTTEKRLGILVLAAAVTILRSVIVGGIRGVRAAKAEEG